jgi:hypothetical protein
MKYALTELLGLTSLARSLGYLLRSVGVFIFESCSPPHKNGVSTGAGGSGKTEVSK